MTDKTEQQEYLVTEKFPEEVLAKHRDMWLKIGRAYGKPLPEKQRIQELFDAVYKEAGYVPPTAIVTLKNPLEGAIAAAYMTKNTQLFQEFCQKNQVEFDMNNQTASSDDGKDLIARYIKSVKAEKIKDAFPQDRVDEIRTQLIEQLGQDGPRLSLTRNNVWDQLSKCGYGLHDASSLSFYSVFYVETPQVKGPEKLLPLMNVAKEGIGWFWPFDGTLVVTPQPTYVAPLVNGRTHKSDGPAITYDGLEVYVLNGILFTEPELIDMINSKPEDIEPSKVLEITNVEKRSEIIKKIGVINFMKHLNPKVLHEASFKVGGDYKLLEVMVGQNRRIYLEMINPSTAETHVEAVPPECKTVHEALNWREDHKISLDYKMPLVRT